jgi:hypothetical protein
LHWLQGSSAWMHSQAIFCTFLRKKCCEKWQTCLLFFTSCWWWAGTGESRTAQVVDLVRTSGSAFWAYPGALFHCLCLWHDFYKSGILVLLSIQWENAYLMNRDGLATLSVQYLTQNGPTVYTFGMNVHFILYVRKTLISLILNCRLAF